MKVVAYLCQNVVKAFASCAQSFVNVVELTLKLNGNGNIDLNCGTVTEVILSVIYSLHSLLFLECSVSPHCFTFHHISCHHINRRCIHHPPISDTTLLA